MSYRAVSSSIPHLNLRLPAIAAPATAGNLRTNGEKIHHKGTKDTKEEKKESMNYEF